MKNYGDNKRGSSFRPTIVDWYEFIKSQGHCSCSIAFDEETIEQKLHRRSGYQLVVDGRPHSPMHTTLVHE